MSVIRAEIRWYKNFSFSGQTSLPPIILTSCGHIVSALHIVGKQTRNNIFQFLLIWINIFNILLIQELDNRSVCLSQPMTSSNMRFVKINTSFLQRPNMKFSRSFGATELGMPEKSKHSLLIYCSSLWCCLSSSSYEFATRSLESLLQNFRGVLCHWNITF